MKNNKFKCFLMVLVLIMTVSFSVSALEFQQPQLLEEMEAEGLIPELSERLPENPMVIEPLHEIGNYGGTANVYNAVSPDVPFAAIFLMGRYGPFRTDRLGNPGEPNLFKDYEHNDDFTEWTFYMREGIKWSDGHPLTAQNWYDMWRYYHTDQRLTPHISEEDVSYEENSVTIYNEHGQERTVKKEVVDDYTIKITSDKPYPILINRMTNIFGSSSQPAPMHFLKQFHPDFIGEEEAEAKAEKAGFSSWTEVFDNFNPVAQGHMTTNQTTGNWPTLSPYVLVEREQNKMVFERNPYFWQVDSEGKQLPYIDRIVAEFASDTEIVNGKIISGDTDFQAFSLNPENIPLYKRYEEEGNYTTHIWDNAVNAAVFEPNYSYEDEVVRNLFREKDFRVALQLAIDSEAINEEILFGRGDAARVTVLPGTKWYKEEYEEKYAEFDPEQAEALLDEMGVVDQNGDGWRQDPDGNDIHWVIEHISGETPYGPITEMVMSDWQSIGINVTRRLQEQSLANTRLGTNEMAMWVWHGDGRDGLVFPTFVTRALSPGHVGSSWMQGFNTEGDAGEYPPEIVEEMFRTHNQMTYATSEEEQIELGQKYLQNSADNVWTISTVNGVPQPIVVTNDMKNFPTKADFPGEGDPIYLHALFWTNPYNPPQFFFENREEINYDKSLLPVMYNELDLDPIDRALDHEWL